MQHISNTSGSGVHLEHTQDPCYELQAYTAIQALESNGDGEDAEEMAEEIWGQQPPKLAGIGMEESDRKCLTAARKYALSYLRLLYLTHDVTTLHAAIPGLKPQPASAEAVAPPDWSDIAR